jgi:YggT family protein
MVLLEMLIYYVFYIYRWLIIGYILLSWFPNARDSSIGNLLSKVVEPYLAIFRRFIPPLGMIDLSPIVALIALFFVEQGVRQLLNIILSAV